VDLSYAVTPLLAWLVAGSLKFAINSVRAGRPAFGLIGYGGLPSNHTTIVASIAALIALREGLDSPVFGLAVAVCFVVISGCLQPAEADRPACRGDQSSEPERGTRAPARAHGTYPRGDRRRPRHRLPGRPGSALDRVVIVPRNPLRCPGEWIRRYARPRDDVRVFRTGRT
jgi:hypothetical protein